MDIGQWATVATPPFPPSPFQTKSAKKEHNSLLALPCALGLLVGLLVGGQAFLVGSNLSVQSINSF